MHNPVCSIRASTPDTKEVTTNQFGLSSTSRCRWWFACSRLQDSRTYRRTLYVRVFTPPPNHIYTSRTVPALDKTDKTSKTIFILTKLRCLVTPSVL